MEMIGESKLGIKQQQKKKTFQEQTLRRVCMKMSEVIFYFCRWFGNNCLKSDPGPGRKEDSINHTVCNAITIYVCDKPKDRLFKQGTEYTYCIL